ncbi:hypothetical protein C8J56DRAFT_419932 [Mycena floridula]|nr:hypothetical protein C8J56DRAFT_419932 [Mycena floridula]
MTWTVGEPRTGFRRVRSVPDLQHRHHIIKPLTIPLDDFLSVVLGVPETWECENDEVLRRATESPEFTSLELAFDMATFDTLFVRLVAFLRSLLGLECPTTFLRRDGNLLHFQLKCGVFFLSSGKFRYLDFSVDLSAKWDDLRTVLMVLLYVSTNPDWQGTSLEAEVETVTKIRRHLALPRGASAVSGRDLLLYPFQTIRTRSYKLLMERLDYQRYGPSSTIVFRAKVLEGPDDWPENVIVKISTRTAAQESEATIIGRVRNAADPTMLNHLPYIYDSFEIASSEDFYARLTRYFDRAGGDSYVARRITVTVQEELFRASELSPSLPLFAQVIRDFYQCIVWLHRVPRIFHRDITEDNSMFRVKDGLVYGVLIDFDISIAITADWDSRPPSREHRTGTTLTMADDLWGDKMPRRHCLRFELESLVYSILRMRPSHMLQVLSARHRGSLEWLHSQSPSLVGRIDLGSWMVELVGMFAEGMKARKEWRKKKVEYEKEEARCKEEAEKKAGTETTLSDVPNPAHAQANSFTLLRHNWGRPDYIDWPIDWPPGPPNTPELDGKPFFNVPVCGDDDINEAPPAPLILSTPIPFPPFDDDTYDGHVTAEKFWRVLESDGGPSSSDLSSPPLSDPSSARFPLNFRTFPKDGLIKIVLPRARNKS